ncbi:enterobactin exporter EntS [compost metagenome]
MEDSIKQGTSLLRNKIYMRVYSAYATASFGDWFDALAIQVLVGYRWQVSPLMLALIPVAMALPGILLGSVAGAAADRMNKLKLMRACDLLTALLTLLLLLAPNMAWLLPLLALRAAISTVNVPAQQSLTRSIVSKDQLFQASSLNGLVNQGSKIAGPLLGGLALTLLTPQWCIVLNAILRGCSYLLLLSVRRIPAEHQQAPKVQEEQVPLRTLWKEGWSFLLGSRFLLMVMLYGLAGSLAIQVVDFQFTSLFREYSPAGESVLGWMVAASGAGAVLIIVVLSKLGQAISSIFKMAMGYALIGGAIAGLGLLQPGASILWVLLLGFILGLGNGAAAVTFNYILQKETPPHMTGRVFGIQSTVLSAALVIAPLLGGLLVEFAGPSQIFLIVGLLVVALGLTGLPFGRVLRRNTHEPKTDGMEPGQAS